MLYRKKPIIVEAVQWKGTQESFLEILEQFGGTGIGMYHDSEVLDIILRVDTLEGTMQAGKDDWIIKGVAGELYPCKPHIFEATYEAV